MKRYNQICFVTWYPYGRRAREFSIFLRSHTLFTRHLIHSRGWKWKFFFWLDYLYKTLQTLVFLSVHRPHVVIATSPPSLCVMICATWCIMTRAVLLVDAHNSAFARPWVSVPLYKRTLRMAQWVIVHNDEYAKYLKQRHHDIRFFVLQDPIPDFSIKKESSTDSPDYVLVVLSYNRDEPVCEILEAIKDSIHGNKKRLFFKLTGNCTKRPDLVDAYQDIREISFLGFVGNDEYEKLLVNAFGVISMTEMPMVQQSAIMEAIGACVPIITNDSDTNKRILFQGAVLTSPEHRSIQKALHVSVEEHTKLSQEIHELRTYWRNKWEEDFDRLRTTSCLEAHFARPEE